LASKCILLLGGARSGKSAYAQKLGENLGGKVLFVATAQGLDEEMRVRIEAHKRVRPAHWRTLELSSHLAKGIEAQAHEADFIIIDCLTLLMSNLLVVGSESPGMEERIMGEVSSLIEVMDRMQATFVVVSNEVGYGLVPENALGRLYRDLLGKANQKVAARADEVYLLVAGLPLKVK
jgi:adenosylcobinamide kinase/adenosylcobinamide-phosphate guanylyltransferase